MNDTQVDCDPATDAKGEWYALPGETPAVVGSLTGAVLAGGLILIFGGMSGVQLVVVAVLTGLSLVGLVAYVAQLPSRAVPYPPAPVSGRTFEVGDPVWAPWTAHSQQVNRAEVVEVYRREAVVRVHPGTIYSETQRLPLSCLLPRATR